MSRNPKLDLNGGFAEPSDTYCSRFSDDITGSCACRPSFRAVDGSRTIDIPASFSPKSWLAIAGKMANLGIAGFTLYLGVGTDPRAFWLAYLTNWNVTISSLYLLLSFINSFVSVASPSVGHTIVSYRVKITWILLTLSANIGILVTIAFWFMIYDGVMDIATVFPHGILTAAVLLDGLVINAVPIRLRHYLEFVVPFAMTYMLWSYLHSTSDIGNPDYEDEDQETNDDLIYTVLDWKTNPGMTTVVAGVLIFVLSPILQVLLWMISGCRRRYEATDKETMSYVEMRTV
jgi:hypothetical protein